MASKNETVAAVSADEVKLHEKQEMFSNVPLGGDEEKGKKKKKIPRKILHFSDGTLEEYSTDEEEEQPPPKPVDPKQLKWGPWFWYYMSTAACKSLGAADFMGEKLAWFFGITSPKYQYAIDEHERLKAEEEEERQAREREDAAARQREVDQISQLEGGIDSVYNPPTDKSHNTPHGDTAPMTEKQGIDNPGLKY